MLQQSDKMSGLINSIKHEHSCKILYSTRETMSNNEGAGSKISGFVIHLLESTCIISELATFSS